jgi:hypothetical protein
MRKLMAFVAGLIFGIGLLAAGMANPAKVLAFLDLAGAWDPSLGLVMAAAIGVAFLPFSWASTQRSSALGAPMQLPGKRELDRRLIGGSLLGHCRYLSGTGSGTPFDRALAGGALHGGYACWNACVCCAGTPARMSGAAAKELSSCRYQDASGHS